MAVRRRMKENAEEAKKTLPVIKAPAAPLSPEGRGEGSDVVRTPSAAAREDEDSDDDRLFFTPSAPPTGDDIYARAFDQIVVPEMDITDLSDGEDDDDGGDLSGLPTVERRMRITERERQKMLRQSVPDDWKPHAVVADEEGEETVIEVELDEEDKAAMAKLRAEMNRRWKELHPTQSRYGEAPLKPRPSPPIRQDDAADMVDAGAEAAEVRPPKLTVAFSHSHLTY